MQSDSMCSATDEELLAMAVGNEAKSSEELMSKPCQNCRTHRGHVCASDEWAACKNASLLELLKIVQAQQVVKSIYRKNLCQSNIEEFCQQSNN